MFNMNEEKEEEFHMKYLPLEELVKVSDVITIHVPLLESTRHIIGKQEIESMKNGVILINTARGGLIDDQALAEALVSGKVAAAGLDCVEDENLEEILPVLSEMIGFSYQKQGNKVELIKKQ